MNLGKYEVMKPVHALKQIRADGLKVLSLHPGADILVFHETLDVNRKFAVKGKKNKYWELLLLKRHGFSRKVTIPDVRSYQTTPTTPPKKWVKRSHIRITTRDRSRLDQSIHPR